MYNAEIYNLISTFIPYGILIDFYANKITFSSIDNIIRYYSMNHSLLINNAFSNFVNLEIKHKIKNIDFLDTCPKYFTKHIQFRVLSFWELLKTFFQPIYCSVSYSHQIDNYLIGNKKETYQFRKKESDKYHSQSSNQTYMFSIDYIQNLINKYFIGFTSYDKKVITKGLGKKYLKINYCALQNYLNYRNFLPLHHLPNDCYHQTKLNINNNVFSDLTLGIAEVNSNIARQPKTKADNYPGKHSFHIKTRVLDVNITTYHI